MEILDRVTRSKDDEVCRQVYSHRVIKTLQALAYALPVEVFNKYKKELVGSSREVRGNTESQWTTLTTHMLMIVSNSIASDRPSDRPSAFDQLCASYYHEKFRKTNPTVFSTTCLPTNPTVHIDLDVRWDPTYLQEYAARVFVALHLLYEDTKLSISATGLRDELGRLLRGMADQLGMEDYVLYYDADQANCSSDGTTVGHQGEIADQVQDLTQHQIPDILKWIRRQMHKANTASSYYTTLDVQSSVEKSESFLSVTSTVLHVFSLLFPLQPCGQQEQLQNTLQAIYLLTDNAILRLEDIPFGVRLPIVEAIRTFRENPPVSISNKICRFVCREDLLGELPLSLGSIHSTSTIASSPSVETQSIPAPDMETGEDGLAHVTLQSQTLFPSDQRMKEVARLLRSNRPLCLKLQKTPDVSDQQFVKDQQERLLLLCSRSISLSVARGMVTMGSLDVQQSGNQLPRIKMPPLPLQGRTPPTNAIVSLDVSDSDEDHMCWPQFHNGCATGLRLPGGDLDGMVNRHWIKYHFPRASGVSTKSSREAQAAHAGFLLALGLRGHLHSLSMRDAYTYVAGGNEYLIIGVLLGMASTAGQYREKSLSAARDAIEDESDEPPMHRMEEESRGHRNSREADWKSNRRQSTSRRRSMNPRDSFAPSEAPTNQSSHEREDSFVVGTSFEYAFERSVSKLLCLYVPSLRPPATASDSISPTAQVAALVGLGILFKKSGHRLTTELLLREITRSPASAQFGKASMTADQSAASFDMIEAYSLAAGASLGLVLLGRGNRDGGDPSLSDLALEMTLHSYIQGGVQQQDVQSSGSCLYRSRAWTPVSTDLHLPRPSAESFGSGKRFGGNWTSNTKPRRESAMEHINTSVTAPGSILALSFMYMQSGSESVAATLALPDNLLSLDAIRPDVLMLRMVGKNLVLWHNVKPTMEWVTEEIPSGLGAAFQALDQRDDTSATTSRPMASSNVDKSVVCNSYYHAVAGGCLSIGLRFAGTGDTNARETITRFLLDFRQMRLQSANNGRLEPSRETVERCLGACAQALALVDCGKGRVETLTVLRSLNLRQRADSQVTFGNHMALSIALGLLFVGGGRGTISRTKEALAMLLISLYPLWPLDTADNKYHLQALRHLYVFAVDTSRFVETIEVGSGKSVSSVLQVELRESERQETGTEYRMIRTPGTLPELSAIKRIRVESDEYYPVEIVMNVSTLNHADIRDGSANTSRIRLLCERNKILLKARKPHVGQLSSASSSVGQEEQLRQFKKHFELLKQDGNGDTVSKWWNGHCRRIVAIAEASQLPLLFPVLVDAAQALFRLTHLPIRTAMDVWHLQLFCDYYLDVYRSRQGDGMTRSRDLSMELELGRVFRNGLNAALQSTWRSQGVEVPSMVVAQAQLSSVARTKGLLYLLVRYYAPVESYDAPLLTNTSWLSRLETTVSECMQSKDQGSTFEVERFIKDDNVSRQVKQTWLQVATFMLYAS